MGLPHKLLFYANHLLALSIWCWIFTTGGCDLKVPLRLNCRHSAVLNGMLSANTSSGIPCNANMVFKWLITQLAVLFLRRQTSGYFEKHSTTTRYDLLAKCLFHVWTKVGKAFCEILMAACCTGSKLDGSGAKSLIGYKRHRCCIGQFWVVLWS